MQEREMYLFLCSIYRISQEEIDILKAQFGKLEVLMYLDEKEILKNKNLNSKLLKNIVKYRSHSRIENIKGVLEEKDIQYVCFSDDGLYCLRKYAKELSDIGMDIVSGLALGIDSEAHLACMNGRFGKTVAVLGSPIDNILPSRNRKIADKILENGGIIVSEFFLGSKVHPLNFSFRNRIISGLSVAVLVIEAAQKSGTKRTFDYAGDQGKTVFAMTGRINDPKSRGCIDMIIEGAIPFTSVENIFRDKSVFLNAKEFCTLNNCKDSIEYDIKSLNYEKKEILELIKRQGNIKIDDICNYTGMDIKTINSNVNELLIDDYIIEMENKTYGFNV